MLQILNYKEAKEWTAKNLYDADCFLYPVKLTVKNGLLIEIEKEHFVVVETGYNGCTYVIEKIWKLTDEEMKENDLDCRYRYKEKVIKHPDNYKSWLEHEAGFNL